MDSLLSLVHSLILVPSVGMLRPYKAKRLIWDDLTLFLDLVECAMGVPMASVLNSLGGLMTEEWSSKRCLLYLGTALLSSLGMHW